MEKKGKKQSNWCYCTSEKYFLCLCSFKLLLLLRQFLVHYPLIENIPKKVLSGHA